MGTRQTYYFPPDSQIIDVAMPGGMQRAGATAIILRPQMAHSREALTEK